MMRGGFGMEHVMVVGFLAVCAVVIACIVMTFAEVWS